MLSPTCKRVGEGILFQIYTIIMVNQNQTVKELLMEQLNSISELIKSLEDNPDIVIEKEQVINHSRDESGEIIEKDHLITYKIKTNNIQCFKQVWSKALEILDWEDDYVSDLISEVIERNEQKISFTIMENDLLIPEEYQFTYLPVGAE